ncbi:MAG: hypothetical protein HKN25_08565 [Pyrinomonadaceae bacterium]|nr:hypothetical protein [Pyrinomonadaceae bacterium]
MKYKMFIWLAIGLSFILVPAGFAQSPNKVLKKATKALGKKKAIKAANSWRKSGLITRVKDGTQGDFMMQASKPNRFHAKFDFRGFETETGFNGKSGWIRNSREGLKTLTGKESDDFKAEVLLRNWRWIDYKKRKAKISSGGKGAVNERPANIVFLTNRNGVRIKLYFDASTHLLLREDIPAGAQTKTYYYSDYRPINGVKEAFKIETTVGDEKFRISLDQVVYNQPIDSSAFNFPNISGEPLPDIPGLLRELQANSDRIDEILENYSYSQKVTKRELTKDGILKVTKSETNQLSFYKGNRISRLVAKNGKPLTTAQQKKEDKEVEKRVRKIEKKIAKQEARKVSQSSNGSPDGEGRRISVAEVLRASKLLNPRREILGGRSVIVFDFEPNPDFDFSNAKSFLKFFGKTAGVMWIDENDKQVVRLEAVLADSYKIGGGILAKLRKGASFALENDRINDEIWLPSRADINLSVRVLLFGGVKVNQIVESFDYRKFKTEVEDSKVNELKQP